MSKIEQLISSREFSYLQPYFYNNPYALRCELGTGDEHQYMANAKKRLIAATGNKIGTAGFSRICDGDEGIQLITDNTCDKDALLALQERGVQVIKV